MKKLRAYRHGEIAFIEIDKLPEGLKKSDSKVIIQGSHGNSHTISQGELYFRNEGDYIFGYLTAKTTKLQHYEHGNICSVCGYENLIKNTTFCPKCNTDFVKDKKFRLSNIRDGVYELRKQHEHTPQGLSPIID